MSNARTVVYRAIRDHGPHSQLDVEERLINAGLASNPTDARYLTLSALRYLYAEEKVVGCDSEGMFYLVEDSE
jgi:hypothetical protein